MQFHEKKKLISRVFLPGRFFKFSGPLCIKLLFFRQIELLYICSPFFQQQQQNVLQVAPRIATNLSPAHLVQHHPPPLRMVQISAPQNLTNGPGAVVTTVALPTAPAPIRHALPQSPVGRPLPQLPRSPLKQNQLQQAVHQHQHHHHRTVVQHQPRPAHHHHQHHHAGGHQPQLRTNAVTVTNGGQQCIMVNPNRNNHLSMLPQAPTPGLMPSAASVQGLLPQSPSTLVPVPAHHRIQQAVAVTASPTNILPPTLLNRQLFSRTVQEANHDG